MVPRNILLIAALLALSAAAAEPAPKGPGLALSPAVLELLRAEMRGVTEGVQRIPPALAAADWKTIQEVGTRIRASYILESKLTPAQAAELERVLPARFKALDAEFHAYAEHLGTAAAARDPALVAYRFSRLLESCAGCHAEFAGGRFPGFAPEATPEHHH